MTQHTYTCAMCEGAFIADWTNEEAEAELHRDFGEVPLEECDQVCDDCYQRISPQNNPEYHADYMRKSRTRFNVPLPTATALEDTETIRAYVDAELTRRLCEAMDEWEREQLSGN